MGEFSAALRASFPDMPGFPELEREEGAAEEAGFGAATRDTALRVDAMLLGALGHLDGIAHLMRARLELGEFKARVLHIGFAMGELVELSHRLHALFPDIVPIELRPGGAA